jgi:hypothetical protein
LAAALNHSDYSEGLLQPFDSLFYARLSCSMLAFRQADDEAVQLFGDLDLA